jgi:hypothetical protein
MSFHTTDSAHPVTFFPIATSKQEATVAILQDYAIHAITVRFSKQAGAAEGNKWTGG